MTNTKKMTKRDYFNTLLNIEEVKQNETLVNFINHELELLAKKNSGDKKPTATQIVNESIKDTIYEVLTTNGGLMTVTEIQKANESLSELSNQKVSALIRQMSIDGKVEKVEEKRKSYFKAV